MTVEYLQQACASLSSRCFAAKDNAEAGLGEDLKAGTHKTGMPQTTTEHEAFSAADVPQSDVDLETHQIFVRMVVQHQVIIVGSYACYAFLLNPEFRPIHLLWAAFFLLDMVLLLLHRRGRLNPYTGGSFHLVAIFTLIGVWQACTGGVSSPYAMPPVNCFQVYCGCNNFVPILLPLSSPA